MPSLFASLKRGGRMLDLMREEHRKQEVVAKAEANAARAAGGDLESLDPREGFVSRVQARQVGVDTMAAKISKRAEGLHPNAEAAEAARAKERERRGAAAHARAMRRASAEAERRLHAARAAGAPPPPPREGGADGVEVTFDEAPAPAPAPKPHAARGVLVTLHVGFRGARVPAEVTLTADEQLSYTVGDLLERVARETGVAALARGTLVLVPPRDDELGAAAVPPHMRVRRDPGQEGVVLTPLNAAAYSLGVRDGSALYVRPSVRPPTPGGANAGGATSAERLREQHVATVWRGALTVERDPRWIAAASDGELLRLLQQACAETDEARVGRGIDGDDEGDEGLPKPRHARRRLEACAEAALPAWEGYRVLACTTASDVLRVAPGTTDPAVLKAAFRKTSLTVHPDRNASEPATEAMRRVAWAFKQLYRSP